jgi:hypothetical protein
MVSRRIGSLSKKLGSGEKLFSYRKFHQDPPSHCDIGIRDIGHSLVARHEAEIVLSCLNG